MEALLETMEVMTNPEAMRAIARDQSSEGKFLSLSALDENQPNGGCAIGACGDAPY
jgi:hypothetical protein